MKNIKLYIILLTVAWELLKKIYLPILIFIAFILGISNCSASLAQEVVTFTPSEVEILAKHNIQRKECLELNAISLQQIDSLNLKVNLLEQQSEIKNTTIINFRSVVSNYEKVDLLRIEQNKELLKTTEQNTKTIKKQNRRLNFWRIFTPITVTATAILGLLL